MIETTLPLNKTRNVLSSVIALSSDSSSLIQHDSSVSTVLQEGKSSSSSINNNGRPESRSASGLPDNYFNVLSADKSETLSIPPDLIEPTAGSANYLVKNQNNSAPTFAFYLCKMYTSGSTCAHGALCDFIHSRHVLADPPGLNTRVKVIRVHWSFPVSSLAEAPYERHEPGAVFYINQGSSGDKTLYTSHNTPNPRRLPSEYVYKTKGSEEALLNGSAKLLRLCKHYEREKCARGSACNFIHRVRLMSMPRAPAPPPLQPQLTNQATGFNIINSCQGPGGVQRPYSTGIPCMTGELTAPTQSAGVMTFGACGTQPTNRGFIITPPLQQQQQPQQQQRLHQQPQQLFAQTRGFSFTPVYTSQQTSYTASPQDSISAVPFQGPASFYTQHHHHHQHHQPQLQQQQQQQQSRLQDVSQNPTPELAHQSIISIPSTPDSLLSQLLFTFM
ncbi:hypothetical protein DQ04_01701030 [Trypanosoma grayi]|uniref:hypothetical protein n=1 Tax=Trypanosoma grayi TaxID=71804 RepID=UPI0004F4705A|nr:hypothetical protein DQ04_01701030 [Trypanosoma grayi]KEG12452.1 hypothetical protein DQ04_01701030 [Trypanosoma grayi]